MGVTSTVSIDTARLIVRDHREGDLPGLVALLTDRVAMRYLPEIFCETEARARENLANAMAEIGKPDRERFFFAIEERSSGRYVGEIGFTVLERRSAGSRADLGYFILPEFRGKGFVTEAGRAVVDFAFGEAGVFKMVTGCLAENGPSERVMRKIGFTKEGALRRQQWHEGTWKDRLVYGLLREDWRA